MEKTITSWNDFFKNVENFEDVKRNTRIYFIESVKPFIDTCKEIGVIYLYKKVIEQEIKNVEEKIKEFGYKFNEIDIHKEIETIANEILK